MVQTLLLARRTFPSMFPNSGAAPSLALLQDMML